ncbi:metalloregulator ArsR/SmtB family transcription factor [Halobacillus sp. Cin3]|uniref:ArsR/SmtB family transcription factor n=1 Tax=Halobacillus sp. Cin3 TaxID=2928441 RepID=UPI00248D6C80|nr:metalloregulator ArsR/SmtB family transcription factor [Halobacillus sp. Cin3]
MKTVESKAGTEEDFSFDVYEKKFKALADELRLKIMYELNQKGQLCVCDLTELVGLPQSKLSYHLKILHDAGFIQREKKGTWNYYQLNDPEVKAILSPELCCIFYPGQ